jgi:hypothetical protein
MWRFPLTESRPVRSPSMRPAHKSRAATPRGARSPRRRFHLCLDLGRAQCDRDPRAGISTTGKGVAPPPRRPLLLRPWPAAVLAARLLAVDFTTPHPPSRDTGRRAHAPCRADVSRPAAAARSQCLRDDSTGANGALAAQANGPSRPSCGERWGRRQASLRHPQPAPPSLRWADQTNLFSFRIDRVELSIHVMPPRCPGPARSVTGPALGGSRDAATGLEAIGQ